MEKSEFLSAGKHLQKKYRDIHLEIYEKDLVDIYPNIAFNVTGIQDMCGKSITTIFVEGHDNCFSHIKSDHPKFDFLLVNYSCIDAKDKKLYSLYRIYFTFKSKVECGNIDEYNIKFDRECLSEVEDHIVNFFPEDKK